MRKLYWNQNGKSKGNGKVSSRYSGIAKSNVAKRIKERQIPEIKLRQNSINPIEPNINDKVIQFRKSEARLLYRRIENNK